MIDGIKIECSYLTPKDWQNCKDLRYLPRVDMETGEVVPQTLDASYNGLTFKIRPSSEYGNSDYMEVVGSLHKYHNEGGNNANDFSRSSLANVITDLSDRFHIDPIRSPLRGLEFGVNIVLPYSVDKFLKSIICMPDKEFVRINVDKPSMGRVCRRSEYEVKIYDKSMQANIPASNILRIELKVKKMRFVAKYGIKTLADLLQADKLLVLGKVLMATMWDVVFYEYGFLPPQLTSRERKKLEEYTNPHRWRNATKDQRYKLKKSMRKFLLLHGGNGLIASALLEVHNKWLKLVECPQIMGDDFTAFYRTLSADKKAMISPLECRVNMSPLDSIGGNLKQTDKKVDFPHQNHPHDLPLNERTFCMVCGRGISRQKKGSLYCSEKHFGRGARRCRDKAYGIKRTQRQRLARELEEKEALRLLHKLPASNIQIKIYWKTKTGLRQAVTLWDEVDCIPDILPYRIYRLEAIEPPNLTPQIFTSWRARMIVKEIL